MKGKINGLAVGVMLAVVLLPSISFAYEYCCNNTYLCSAVTWDGGSKTFYNICELGCINSTFEGHAMCRVKPKPISSEMYLFFEAVSVGMIVFSMVRKRDMTQDRVTYTYQHGIISLIATIMFFALAILTTELIVQYVNWMFAAIGTIWTVYLYTMSFYPDKKTPYEDNQAVA